MISGKYKTILSDTIISIAIVQLTAACMVSAAMAMSCAIAYTMRYVRANVEGGVEMGFKAKDAKKIVLQTIKGAVELLQATGEHPESAIDKVTTLDGCTIKGLNTMEQEGFTNAVIKGLLAGKR